MAGLLLGYDLGSSAVKAALVDIDSGRLLAQATSPDTELEIAAPRPGWAEQDPGGVVAAPGGGHRVDR